MILIELWPVYRDLYRIVNLVYHHTLSILLSFNLIIYPPLSTSFFPLSSLFTHLSYLVFPSTLRHHHLIILTFLGICLPSNLIFNFSFQQSPLFPLIHPILFFPPFTHPCFPPMWLVQRRPSSVHLSVWWSGPVPMAPTGHAGVPHQGAGMLVGVLGSPRRSN